MKWEVEINGHLIPETFDSEDAANQHAANIRGADRGMRIEVRQQGAPKADQKPKTEAAPPIVGMLDAIAEQQSKTAPKK